MDIITETWEEVHNLVSGIPSLSPFNAVVACTALFAFIKLVHMSRRRVRTPKLQGPPSPSIVYGVGKMLSKADAAYMYESWAHKYGDAYELPATLGGRKIVLYDPKAIAHFHAKQSWLYSRTPMLKKSLELRFGPNLFAASGENHARQRKSLTPAFSIAAIRNLTSIFYDSAYKAKGAWSALIESSGYDSTIIDVQRWMNYVSLDTTGRAGFSHDFGALDGKHASVTEMFDTFTASPSASAINVGLDLLADVFPSLVLVPTPRMKLMQKLNSAMEETSNILLARTKHELDTGIVDEKAKSIIGQLIKGQRTESQFHLTQEEVLSQMNVLLLAGYETTSISLTWALIELSRNPEIQTKLRNELLEFGPGDPTYDQLSNDLPYLDAVVHETLRTHPAVRQLSRIACEDDVIPLAQPIRTKSGELIENITIAKGTFVTVPIESINRSEKFWSDDAKVFRPSRWLEDEHGHNGIPASAREIQGHRHLLTFSNGSRACLGRNFVVAEFKVVLSVLIKNFVFELRDGADTKIEMGQGITLRPSVEGEIGCKMPLRVRPYMG